MIGIYKITNLTTGKSYVGQSCDIEKRFREHKSHANYQLGKDIRELGEDNFSFEILEECEKDQLDSKEDYYIRFYNTIDNGYNIIGGGQNNVGESNSNAKLTENEVYAIREAYKNHESPREIYKNYSDKVTFKSFQSIWQGRSWKNVHNDVYTDENKAFYRVAQVKDYSYNANRRTLTDNDIYNIREYYNCHRSKEEVYKLYSDKISESYFLKIWSGVAYPDIHADVFSEENRRYQRIQSVSNGSLNSIFSEDEILYYRRKYYIDRVPIAELHRECLATGKNCIYCSFHSMITGSTYSTYPSPVFKVIDKSKYKEACNDYLREGE